MKERTRGRNISGLAISLFATALLVAGCGAETDSIVGGSGMSFPPPDGSNTPPSLDEGNTPLAGNTAVLLWEPPGISSDGRPLTDLAGYRVYYGKTSPLSTTSSSWVFVDGDTTYTFTDLDSGTIYFAITAIDIAGNESAFSNEGSKTFL